MNVLNISRLGNQIPGIEAVGINVEGSIILCGYGGKLSFYQGIQNAHRLVFYLYNPETEELVTDLFKDLNIVDIPCHEYKCIQYLGNGVGYYIEAPDEQTTNIVRCDFNRIAFERVYTICSIDIFHTTHLFALTDRCIALKQYNKASCKISIYDIQLQKQYSLSFPESDNLRYAYIHCHVIGGKLTY